ncbi:ASTA-R [Lepeophtheirus salmonis]|uniref:ASTA-R n=1 Tax=Lepeophtheirus salmonis TaxID=72036 RepID=A0A0K2TK81_LEPSM|nr:ASTA-R [Lepeophtheirus salmonis]CAF2967075.1 ASTA-R [Lepeophtheirus salmonis]
MDLIDFCELQESELKEHYHLYAENATDNFTIELSYFLNNHKTICNRLWIEELNLALSDLLLLIICIPPTAVDYAVGWPFGKELCIVVQYLIHVTVYGSIYTLVLLSLDRYLAVVYPVQSITIRTVCNAFIVISITWVLAFTSCSPIFFLFHTKTVSSIKTNEERNVCTFNRDEYSHIVEVTYQTTFFVTSLVIPVIAIISLYISMLHRLWRGTAATHGRGPARDKRCVGQENKRRVTRMIIFVVIVFVLCWSPLQVVMLLKSFKLYEINQTSLVAFQIICHCLAYCNSCLNPFLYAFLSSNFRETFKKSIFFPWKRNNPSNSPINNNHIPKVTIKTTNINEDGNRITNLGMQEVIQLKSM